MVFRRLLPHEELLVALLRRPGVADGHSERVRLLNDPHSRAAFQRDARRHGALGMALTVLHQNPEFSSMLAPAVAEELFAPLPMLRRQAAFWDLERGRVVHRLQSSGVDPIVLKGAALRLTTYAESVERSFADLDVLVQEHEMPAAVAALEGAKYTLAYGDARSVYEAHHFHYIMQHPGGYTVEIHWGLTAPAAQVRLDTNAIRNRSVRLDAPHAARARVPSPEDMVLHLICQNLEDGFAKLQRIVDVDRVVAQSRQFDWPYLVDAARRGGAHTAAAVALQLGIRLLGTPLPRPNAADMFDVSSMSRAGLASLHPVSVHVHPPKRGYDLRRELLLLWTTNGTRSWWWALGQRLRAQHYLFWGVAPSRTAPSVLDRTIGVAKLLALQGWSWLTAVAALATRSGRTALRFWST